MKTSVLSMLFLLSCIFSVGCSPVENNKNGGSSDASSDTPATPTSDSSPLYLILNSKYENGTALTSEGECSIASTASTAATKFVTCSIEVPELRLYFSELQFTFGTANAASCPHLSFRPYYYARNKDDTVTFSGNTEDAKCSKYDEDATCWGGAAFNMLEKVNIKFPQSDSMYISPETGALSTIVKLDSSNTIRAAIATAVTAESMSVNNSYRTNVNAANNLLSASRGAAYNTGYVNYYGSSEYYDYLVSCYDEYYEPQYSITLTISDKDTSTAEGISNDKYDWN